MVHRRTYGMESLNLRPLLAAAALGLLLPSGAFRAAEPQPAAALSPAASLESLIGPEAPACGRIGFRPIPLDEIGLCTDGFRPALPVDLLRAARDR